jgi:serine/threonine protein kinase
MADEEHLADLLLTWEDRFEQGEDIPAESLCRDRPDLAPALAARMMALKKIAWIKAPVWCAEDVANAVSSNREDRPRQGEPGSMPPMLAGRYRLDSLIAEGGFGQVWRGFDMELQRPVAVKVPRCSRSMDPERVEDFLAEARKVARLKHPGIVPVYDVARHEGVYFIVLALIDGTDLGRYEQRQRLSMREAVGIIVEAADALDHANRQGIIHRDIKPANILLDRTGKVYLTDFGIAATNNASPDHAEQVCGTLPYMAPERLTRQHERADTRSDIYSLGVILHDLLQAVPPNQRRPGPDVNASTCEGMADCMDGCEDASKSQSPQPPSRLTVPSCLESIYRKCLSLCPDDRYASAGELAEALRHALAGLLNEADWMACTDLTRRLTHLYNLNAPARKIRLFACACVRHHWEHLGEASRKAVEIAERYADGEASPAELEAAEDAAWDACTGMPEQAAAWAAYYQNWRAALEASRTLPWHVQDDFLHDLFGPLLFRQVMIDPVWLDRNDRAVHRIAEAIYDERAFDRMTALGAALKDGGCNDPEILAHCFGTRLHARGCWLIDLLLGKE